MRGAVVVVGSLAVVVRALVMSTVRTGRVPVGRGRRTRRVPAVVVRLVRLVVPARLVVTVRLVMTVRLVVPVRLVVTARLVVTVRALVVRRRRTVVGRRRMRLRPQGRALVMAVRRRAVAVVRPAVPLELRLDGAKVEATRRRRRRRPPMTVAHGRLELAVDFPRVEAARRASRRGRGGPPRTAHDRR